MNRKNVDILKKLDKLFPDAGPELNFKTPFELLVATILSAQCTDIRVNIITKVLFDKANTPEKMLQLGQKEIQEIIKSCGIYKAKAKYIFNASSDIVDKFDSKVPETVEELMKLSGVGIKTANVVVSNAFGIPAIAVDTHVFRVANRLGLAKANNVQETEKQLMRRIPKERWIKLHHQLIFMGRRICKARNPLCSECILKKECQYYNKIE